MDKTSSSAPALSRARKAIEAISSDESLAIIAFLAAEDGKTSTVLKLAMPWNVLVEEHDSETETGAFIINKSDITAEDVADTLKFLKFVRAVVRSTHMAVDGIMSVIRSAAKTCKVAVAPSDEMAMETFQSVAVDETDHFSERLDKLITAIRPTLFAQLNPTRDPDMDHWLCQMASSFMNEGVQWAAEQPIRNILQHITMWRTAMAERKAGVASSVTLPRSDSDA